MAPGEDKRPTKILIIDDDRKLCRLVAEYLTPMGYQVDEAHNGVQGLERALAGDYDAVILDVMMPGLDGFEVLQRLRRESAVPVLMLTMRGDEADRIVGLEMGADDYLPKTFSSRELLARLRAVIRRSAATAAKQVVDDDTALEFGGLRIDPPSRAATLDGHALDLTTVEFDLLVALARSADRVLSREQLLERVAGRDYDVFDRSIDVHVSSLRRKLGDSAKQPRFIKTVWAVGYMFLGDATESA